MKLLTAIRPEDLPQIELGLAWPARTLGNCTAAHDQTHLEACLTSYEYDAALVSTNFLGDKVTETLRNWRAAHPQLALIVLGPSKVELISRCLRAGADDYMRVPALLEETLARLRACIRRHRGHAAEQIAFGGFVVDLEKQQLYVEGQEVHLSTKLFQLLTVLALHANRTLSKEKLCEFIYNSDTPPHPKIFDVLICKLRGIFRTNLGYDPIKTVWGRGYILEMPHGTDEQRTHASDDSGCRRAGHADRAVESRS